MIGLEVSSKLLYPMRQAIRRIRVRFALLLGWQLCVRVERFPRLKRSQLYFRRKGDLAAAISRIILVLG